MRVELYLLVAGVTVSQDEFAVLPAAAGKYGPNVTLCVCRRAGWDDNTLDCVDCGGCLLDASSQPITVGCALHEFLHRFREVSITTPECVLI
jgi:hypothetical protein